jgi:hypothetical protein
MPEVLEALQVSQLFQPLVVAVVALAEVIRTRITDNLAIQVAVAVDPKPLAASGRLVHTVEMAMKQGAMQLAEAVVAQVVRQAQRVHIAMVAMVATELPVISVEHLATTAVVAPAAAHATTAKVKPGVEHLD